MTLQQLKKGEPKYDFLTNVLDYARENYGEILDELDEHNIEEIIDEIKNDNSKKNIYRIIGKERIECFRRYCTFQVRKAYVGIDEYIDKNENFEDRWSVYAGSWTGKLSELYFVNDYEKYYNYLNNVDEERKQKAIEEYEKIISDRNDLLKKSKKYSLPIPDEDEVERLELIENLKSQDLSVNESLEAFKKLIVFTGTTSDERS